MSLPAKPPPDPDFDAILERLDRLSRDHNLLFQLEVGGAVLEDFFGGEASAYLSRDPVKPARFTTFLELHGARLQELGLGGVALRRCVVMRIVYDSLPVDVRSSLRISHYVELGKVDDLATRRLLAQASAENAWTAAQLRDAVTAIRQGRWIDGDLEIEGLQPPEPEPEPEPPLQLGRVVTRFERGLDDFRAVVADWRQVATKKTTRKHRKRVRESMLAHQAEIADLLASLGED